jgi:hypothetical protein
MSLKADEFRDGRLWNGFDYERQAWAKDGMYITCGHKENVKCRCYGRVHAGEMTIPNANETEKESK